MMINIKDTQKESPEKLESNTQNKSYTAALSSAAFRAGKYYLQRKLRNRQP
jgi:hypothetical protein